ncbi:MAG: o-succinylbenzoate--CoA ligase [Melioribacter sp.]|nr:o-succinylbenzoate--CoA ligase [Melioribacter sp.]
MITISNKEHWLIEQASRYPHNAAIQTEQGSILYQKFLEECNLTANYLLTNDVRENDRVGILYTHSYKFFVIVNALWFIGAIPVPLNTRKTINEIEDELHIADVKFLIIDDSLKSQFSTLEFQNVLDINIIKIHETRKHNFIIRNSQFSILNCSLIMFTSGSTGNPKAVVHTFKSLYESVLTLNSFAELSPNDIWLASLPFYHIGGFMILIRSLIAACTVIFPTSPKFEDIEQTIKRSNPSHISLVPTTLRELLDHNVKPNKNLKFVFLGGGPSQTELIQAAVKKSWPIVKVYGSTETCSMVTALHPDDIKSKPDSAGKLIGQNKIKIINKDKNALGEIAVSSKSLFKEYYNDQQTTNNKLQNDWYYTGDYGWIDDEGYLYIESRRDDLIISGGENISAYEVELIIRKYPLVKDVIVFGLQDKTWGQIVCTAIVSETTSEDEIKDFLKEKIAAYKIPKRFFIVDEIPRNEMDKVNRTELLKMLKLS